MSTAAKQLFVSQSSVSQAISEIEREYDVALFERVGKQLFITPLGRELLEYARRAVSYQDSIDAWLRQCSQVRRLRAGATITIGATVFSEILNMVEDACPGIEIFGFVDNTDTIVDKLLCNELDIALVEGNVTNPNIDSRVVMDDHMVLVCPRQHRFYGRSSVSIRELEGERFLLREHGSGTRAQTVEMLKEYGIGYVEGWECCSSEAIKRGVIDGHGISILSERLVRGELASGELWRCTIEEFPIYRHFSIVSYAGKIPTDTMGIFSRAVEEFAAKDAALRNSVLPGQMKI